MSSRFPAPRPFWNPRIYSVFAATAGIAVSVFVVLSRAGIASLSLGRSETPVIPLEAATLQPAR